jgi:hypothetical protein
VRAAARGADLLKHARNARQMNIPLLTLATSIIVYVGATALVSVAKFNKSVSA